MDNNTTVVFSNVTKHYPVYLSIKSLLTFHFRRKRKLILDDVSFEVRKGEIFGIVGPNGAGKTTTLKILCHLTTPDSGNAVIFNHDIEKESTAALRHIGYCISEERSFFWRLSGRQNLQFFADLLEVPVTTANKRINELLEFLDLQRAADDRFMNYSAGMKQKMAVARSLLADPDVLFMDEPTRGLDPRTALRLRSFIKEYIVENQKTAIITTNRVSDIENLCQRLFILNRGRAIAQGTMSEIRSLLRDQHGVENELSFEGIFDYLLETDERKRGD